MSSNARGFHPHALMEPYLSLSAHTAPTLFVRPEDSINLDSEAFISIPEWTAFTEHVIARPRCNEA